MGWGESSASGEPQPVEETQPCPQSSWDGGYFLNPTPFPRPQRDLSLKGGFRHLALKEPLEETWCIPQRQTET